MLAAMGALRLATAAAIAAAMAFVAIPSGCEPPAEFWVCNNPATGKADPSIYDHNHFENGVPDPCHCYDSCGPLPQCPILVDAGPLGPGCDAGTNDAGDAGPDGQ